MMRKGPKTISMGWMSYALNIILIVVCMVFYLQNKQLKHVINFSTSISPMEPLLPGEKVPPFTLTTLMGQSSEISYSDSSRKYLFFVLSTSCPHCENTLPVWKSIAKTANDHCEIIGVSLHNLELTWKCIEREDVGFYLASVESDTSFNRKYRISGVPETMLIKGDGTVEQTWIGELSHEQVKEIETMLSAPVALRN